MLLDILSLEKSSSKARENYDKKHRDKSDDRARDKPAVKIRGNTPERPTPLSSIESQVAYHVYWRHSAREPVQHDLQLKKTNKSQRTTLLVTEALLGSLTCLRYLRSPFSSFSDLGTRVS